MAELSTKPYLIRAIHEWCEDSGYRPYIAVAVDDRTIVPREFVRNGEIVLNVSAAATNRLVLGNELIEFEARFSGAVREVSIPIENVSAIYAQETGHGMAFDVPKALAHPPERAQPSSRSTSTEPRQTQRPKLVPKPSQSGKSSVDDNSQGGDTTMAKVTKLQAVKSGDDGQADRPARGGGPRRRRGKLAAVPSGASPEGASVHAAEPRGAAQTGPEKGAAGGSHAPDDNPDPTPPNDPAPAGGRPRLKRVK